MVIEGDLTWGGEHTIQYTDDVLQNCIPETLYNSINQSYPNKFNKNINSNNKKKTVALLF